MLGEHDDVLALFTNHPKHGDVPSFNAALCGLWAAGLGLAGARGRATGVRSDAADAPVAPETRTGLAETVAGTP